MSSLLGGPVALSIFKQVRQGRGKRLENIQEINRERSQEGSGREEMDGGGPGGRVRPEIAEKKTGCFYSRVETVGRGSSAVSK